MAQIKSLQTLELTSETKGLEDVSYSITMLSAKDKLDIGLKSRGDENNLQLEGVIPTTVSKNCKEIKGLEFDDGTAITNGKQLLAALEKTDSDLLINFVTEIFQAITGQSKAVKELEKK